MTRESLAIIWAIALLALVAQATEAKRVPKNCDPELGCIVVRPRAATVSGPEYRDTGR
jgi:hypothetical protein